MGIRPSAVGAEPYHQVLDRCNSIATLLVVTGFAFNSRLQIIANEIRYPGFVLADRITDRKAGGAERSNNVCARTVPCQDLKIGVVSSLSLLPNLNSA